MYILGINAYHGDSSACIYRDGELIAATEEERIRRVKHWAGLPSEAVKYCLNEAQISLTDVDVITVSRNPFAKLHWKLMYSMRRGIPLRAIKDRAANSIKIKDVKRDLATALGFDVNGVKARLRLVEHHRSHMASSFFPSPFSNAAILSIDGMGDFTSTMRGVGEGSQLRVIDSVTYPHSLGIFYTTITQFLGFPNYGDEYKVMGLSPYGKSTFLNKLRKVVSIKRNGLFELNSEYFLHFKQGVNFAWSGGVPYVERLFSDKFIEEFGEPRSKDEPLRDEHWDLAASAQQLTEEVIFHMAEDLQRKTRCKNLCIAGGVAQNSVANGKIIENTSFANLYVPPAGHDAGTSVGSSLYFYHHQLRQPRLPFKHHAYTGVKFTNEEIEAFLRARDINFNHVEDDRLFGLVSQCLAGGGVVGWFQGRAEFGPRALGNRSILADPRRADAKDLLNAKIKRRESFRPFAPSILKECVNEYFVQVDDVPYMEKVFTIRPEKRDAIPAVTHVDGTGRLQTVDRTDAPRYHALISSFHELAGVPVLLNTSFNENEPIVNSPEDALNCFSRTRMDMLVLENAVIQREQNAGISA